MHKSTQHYRRTVHLYMDAIWQLSSKPKKARTSMYKWLSSKLDIPFEATHVKYFTKEQCRKAIKILKPMYIQLYGKDLPWRKKEKMENLPVIKVFKIDYSFLVKNYLNPELWKKEWTLFAYKTFTVALRIHSIQTRDEKIVFYITIYNHDTNSILMDNKVSDYVECSLKLEDLSFLKYKINSTVFNLIWCMEKVYFIEMEDKFKDLYDKKYEERDRLTAYAEEFLDDAGVSSDACREAYIDAYIDENALVPGLMDSYVISRKYFVLTDFYLTFLDTIKDDPQTNERLEKIQSAIGRKAYEEVLEEIQDFQLEFEDEESFEAEMKSKLEEV